MKSFFWFNYILVSLACGSLSQEVPVITAIEVKTADVSHAGMTLGSIDLELITPEFTICLIENLDSENDDFSAGDINEFTGSQLQECLDFPIPGGQVALLRVTHSGLDAWTPEWIRVINSNESFVQCNDGYEIDNSEMRAQRSEIKDAEKYTV
ncbi:hypothetical protein TCAL_16482 [Tigriopus californicus]|uniref:PLAT domain-containing protein n=1 Tax=Tigriopus californicus TaxID=6832 RepID=A0A553NUC8_TIGCA|nr:hypothetical protein TCAL_16482 [Tigriopus californicus]